MWTASPRPQAAAQRRGEAEREVRVGSSSHRHQDPVHLGHAPLLDDRDVTGCVPEHLIDGRAEQLG